MRRGRRKRRERITFICCKMNQVNLLYKKGYTNWFRMMCGRWQRRRRRRWKFFPDKASEASILYNMSIRVTIVVNIYLIVFIIHEIVRHHKVNLFSIDTIISWEWKKLLVFLLLIKKKPILALIIFTFLLIVFTIYYRNKPSNLNRECIQLLLLSKNFILQGTLWWWRENVINILIFRFYHHYSQEEKESE